MPKSGTDIPHFSFHHHRVGVHPVLPFPESTGAPRKGFAKLVPIDDISHLPEIEQKRCLALAYVKIAEEGGVENPTFYYEVAVKLLEETRASGLRDAEVDATLARMYLRGGNKLLATHRGQAALLDEALPDEIRRDAVGVLSRVYANDREFHYAQPFLEELIRFRYNAEDHLILSICRQSAGDLPGAIQAIEAALKIEPDRPDLHEKTSEYYSLSGNREQAAWHHERARQLRSLLKAVVGEEFQ